jgi:hypothetical protein
MVLRPLEKHVSEKVPMAAKLMGAAEILLGGMLAMKSKNSLLRGVGLGVMAGGVHTVMHQFNLGTHSPAIHGPDDYTTVHVPISGNLENLMNGVIRDDYGATRSNFVAGTDMGATNDLYRTYLLAGIEDDDYLTPKGFNY